MVSSVFYSSSIICPGENKTDYLEDLVKPINYTIGGVNLLTTLAVLCLTRYCTIPGRVFRAFIYNMYGLNLTYILFDIPYQMFEEELFRPEMRLNRSIIGKTFM